MNSNWNFGRSFSINGSGAVRASSRGVHRSIKNSNMAASQSPNWLLFVLVLFLGHQHYQQQNGFVMANIIVVESGQTFISQNDKYIGNQLKSSMKYSARLQRLPGNDYLCPTIPSEPAVDDHNDNNNSKIMWNITRPADGLSGTSLCLMKGTGCICVLPKYCSVAFLFF